MLPGSPTSLTRTAQEGARWLQQIMNRTFKARVIELVILRVPQLLLARRPGKKLIVDYKCVSRSRLHAGARVTDPAAAGTSWSTPGSPGAG